MQIKFDTTGTHVKGVLKVRADFYPDARDKCFDRFNVDRLLREPTQKEWDNHSTWDELRALIGTEKTVNPAICLFLHVPETIKKPELDDLILARFSPDDIATLDSYMAMGAPMDIHYVRPLVRPRLRITKEKVKSTDKAGLVGEVNNWLLTHAINLKTGKPYELSHESITIGTTTGGGGYDSGSSTRVSLHTPASADSVADTYRTDCNAFTGAKGGSFIDNGADEYECHDSESLGNLVAGLNTIVGLSVEFLAASAKYIGSYQGTIDAQDLSPAGGKGEVSGDKCDPADTATYTMSSWSIYLEADAEESGGGSAMKGNTAAIMAGLMSTMFGTKMAS